MKLLIDVREAERINPIRKFIFDGNSKMITDSEVTTLPVGDYVTEDGSIGIEYKKDDFFESVYSKLLEKQLRELSDNYEYPFLLIGFDGIYSMMNHFKTISPNVVIGTLTSIAVRHHISVMFCGDFLGKFIVDLVDKHYDGKNKSKQTNYTPIRTKRVKAQKRQITTKELKLDLVSRLHKIGPTRARELLVKYNWSIREIAEADVEELMEIKGIGETLAKNIKEGLS